MNKEAINILDDVIYSSIVLKHGTIKLRLSKIIEEMSKKTNRKYSIEDIIVLNNRMKNRLLPNTKTTTK